MPNFDPELVQVMRKALDDIMPKGAVGVRDPGDQGVPRRVHSESGPTADSCITRRAEF